mmetsp:Transcript_6500/g.8809  ORF Transcript_6500/g.8809 Transcript_6500/m.8809 type:complete len:93 (+) Transcript_6500:275-553(+)
MEQAASDFVPIQKPSRKATEVDVGCDDKTRFQLELEFVQSLSNPRYLNYLAQTRHFHNPAFVSYLHYLQYWKQPDYARFIMNLCMRNNIISG